MRSKFCQWLIELSDLAEKEGITIEAKYIDALDWFYQSEMSIDSAFERYKQTVQRIIAIQQAAKEVKP